MRLILGDIVDMNTDAIVTAAHSDLRPAPGISQAVFEAADTEKLTAACRKLGRCRIGRAVVTPSCGLPCRYIIHVAGAGWYSGRESDRQLFQDYYAHALQKALAFHCRSVAMPLMFSGSFHIPRAEALLLVAQVISRFEADCPGMEIRLVLYKQSIYDTAVRVLRHQGVPFETL